MLRNWLDMRAMLSLSSSYMDVNLEREEARFNVAKAVHDELEKALEMGEDRGRRSFFDTHGYELPK